MIQVSTMKPEKQCGTSAISIAALLLLSKRGKFRVAKVLDVFVLKELRKNKRKRVKRLV